MVVGAKAEDIVSGIGPVVRLSQWSNVGTLRVRASWRDETIATDLAAMIVAILDPRRNRGIPNQSLN
jgi:hypothetical protein